MYTKWLVLPGNVWATLLSENFFFIFRDRFSKASTKYNYCHYLSIQWFVIIIAALLISYLLQQDVDEL